MEKIDFVIIWVDGNDPRWQAEKAQFTPDKSVCDNRPQRYRDWENLQYWFRGVEKFAPWVNKIHFVTWGHLPKWLNTSHPKLNIVNHADFIPSEYLPTFSANPIELNIHRIKGLADNFVYFNDDTFIIDKVSPENYFKKGLPCDMGVLNVHCNNNDPIQNIAFNDVGIINRHFSLKRTIKSGFSKWFNPKYGSLNLRSLPLIFCPRFPGFYQPHLPAPFKKSTFEILWEKEKETLDGTCKNKFRSKNDVNQWLMREWQLASNAFIPCSSRLGKALFTDSGTTCDEMYNFVSKQKRKTVCLNDGEMTQEQFEGMKSKVICAFDKILPEKSAYEL